MAKPSGGRPARQNDGEAGVGPRRWDRLSSRPHGASNQRLSRGAEGRKPPGLVIHRTQAHLFSALFVMGLLAGGCSGASTRSLGPDTWRVRCKSSMATCAAKADELCSDRGYVVVGGRSYKQIYGPEGQQVADERGELVVRCGTGPDSTLEAADAGPAAWRLPARPDGQPVEPPPDPSTRPAHLVCTPGETQACVGPAACAGGQACKSDGSGFEACDCGSAGSRTRPEALDGGVPSREPANPSVLSSGRPASDSSKPR
jgi:hypothetical protein